MNTDTFSFHPDIPQYVREAISKHMESITFSDRYVTTNMNIVPERYFGHSRLVGDYWHVEIRMEILNTIGMAYEPGSYPTEVSIEFRVRAALAQEETP